MNKFAIIIKPIKNKKIPLYFPFAVVLKYKFSSLIIIIIEIYNQKSIILRLYMVLCYCYLFMKTNNYSIMLKSLIID